MNQPLLLYILLGWGAADAKRCYTDVAATKSDSVECGPNAGCVKIYIDSEEMLLNRQRNYDYHFDLNNRPQLPKIYQNNPVLMRGCFVLKVPDRCYNSRDGLSYCWCDKDLCNSGRSLRQRGLGEAVAAALIALAVAFRTFWFGSWS